MSSHASRVSAKRKQKAERKSGFYPTYPFKDRDPVLDVILKMSKHHSPAAICLVSGISTSTFAAWKVKTRRPKHATMAAYLGGLGFEFAIVRKGRAKSPRY